MWGEKSILGTEWPDEFVKNIAQCVAQYICVKINAYVTFTVAKSWLHISAIFFKKTAQSKNSRIVRKFAQSGHPV
jgi:hypothetical protein